MPWRVASVFLFFFSSCFCCCRHCFFAEPEGGILSDERTGPFIPSAKSVVIFRNFNSSLSSSAYGPSWCSRQQALRRRSRAQREAGVRGRPPPTTEPRGGGVKCTRLTRLKTLPKVCALAFAFSIAHIQRAALHSAQLASAVYTVKRFGRCPGEARVISVA